MGIFNFFSTGLLMGAVDRVSKKIKLTEAFKKLSLDDTPTIREYREFETIMVASSIAFISLDLDLKNSGNKKDIQTIYVGKNADFIRKIISGKIKSRNIHVDLDKAKFLFKGNIEAQLCWQSHLIFEKYLDEIKTCLKSKSASYFWQYERPEINEITGEKTVGESRYFDFLRNLLIPEEKIPYDYESLDTIEIGPKSIFDSNDSHDIDMLFLSFVNDLPQIVKD